MDEIVVCSIGGIILTGEKANYLTQGQTVQNKSHKDWHRIGDKCVQKFGRKHL